MIHSLLARARDGVLPDSAAAPTLAAATDLPALLAVAGELRDRGFGNVVTYSKKVFLPLTHLCRDVCHYCTFAKAPKRLGNPYMPLDEVLAATRESA